MKNLLMILCLMFAIDSQAGEVLNSISSAPDTVSSEVSDQQCFDEMLVIFNDVKELALNQMIGPNERPTLEKSRLWLSSLGPAFEGNASSHNEVIRIDRKLCGRSKEHQRAILSHEFGHLIAFINYALTNSEETKEQLADTYGAKLYKFSGRDTEAYLTKEVDPLCKKGLKYFCIRAEVWRYSLTH